MTAAIVSDLVAWYQQQRRALPWRDDPRPYYVLMSELMLQQTRVDTVIPYFQRFIARWPTLADLAAADESEVLEAWAGLGYYRRARSLHACARAATLAGGLPGSPEALAALPGVGAYTAGAIASIAFGVRAPLVDGNVERVLSRWYAFGDDPRTTAGKRAIWAYAQALHDAAPASVHPGDLNQALMELGATVCSPTKPACDRCPVSGRCQAEQLGVQASFPKLKPKAKPVEIFGSSLVVHTPDGVLSGLRLPGGLLGGLWEPPRVALTAGASRSDAVEALRALVWRERGVTVGEVRVAAPFTHVFTHRRLRCEVFVAELDELPLFARAPSLDDTYASWQARRVTDGGWSKLALKALAAANEPQIG